MNILIRLVIVLWTIRILHNIVCYINLWWVKEYRWDRMLIHLKTNQGKRILFIRFSGFHRSFKTIALGFVMLVISVVTFILLPFSMIINVVIIDILTFPLLSVLVLASNIPLRMYHMLLISIATRKLQEHRNLFVIGITGSFGKTSTKEYLATILSTKYNVLKTEASKNSRIGIAEAVLKSLKPDHDVFIAEMGAYKKREIAEMTKMVKPQVGIITAVNEQHQDLFGSLDNTKFAKYELVEGLIGRKTAVLNIDNHYVAEMAAWAIKDGIPVWGMTQTNIVPKINVDTMFRITNIVQDQQNLSFTISTGKKSAVVRAPVLGIHQTINITAAVAAAIAYSMTFIDAVQAASLIKPIDGMMKPIQGVNGSLFIDDTFNNNPDAAIAAIDYLRITKGKKILVFQPMVELGALAQQAHERVGKYAATFCDEVILTNDNYRDAFIKGMRKVSKRDAQVFPPVKAGNFIKHAVSKEDTVLFKGKEAKNVLNQLKKG